MTTHTFIIHFGIANNYQENNTTQTKHLAEMNIGKVTIFGTVQLF